MDRSAIHPALFTATYSREWCYIPACTRFGQTIVCHKTVRELMTVVCEGDCLPRIDEMRL
jgi:hypothetical protein